MAENEPAAALDAIKRNRFPSSSEHPPAGVNLRLLAEWAQAARSQDIDQLVTAQTERGRRVLAPTDTAWPFSGDPEPPVLLFYTGNLELLDGNFSIAVVGTRRCTSVGRTVAYQLGSDLADAGVGVVSGLALGIDGAAHKGCIDHQGQAIGVVGTGLDVVYPGANRNLWSDVSTKGLLLSEALAGTKPQRWRFPARNRLIAGLCKAAVVVESHEHGGSLLTVDECLDRDRTVFVIPGSVTSPASDGVNRLLVDGAAPARGASDVLEALGHGSALSGASVELGASHRSDGKVPSLQQLILDEASAGPVLIDTLIGIAKLVPSEVMAEIQKMAAEGLISVDGSTISHVPPGRRPET